MDKIKSRTARQADAHGQYVDFYVSRNNLPRLREHIWISHLAHLPITDERGLVPTQTFIILWFPKRDWLKRTSAAKGRIHHIPDLWHCRHPGQNNLVVESTWYKLHKNTNFRTTTCMAEKKCRDKWKVFFTHPSWRLRARKPCAC